MPGLIVHVGIGMNCTHVAPVTTAPAQARVIVSGQPIATSSSLLTVAGCPFQIPVGAGTKPQPCVKVQWLMKSSRVMVGGQPALLQVGPGAGAGMCQSIEQIPQGPPTVSSMQTRVTAS